MSYDKKTFYREELKIPPLLFGDVIFFTYLCIVKYIAYEREETVFERKEFCWAY